MNMWRMDAGGQTLVLATFGGVPECVYWGASLPGGEDLAQLVAAMRMDLTGGMLDAVVPLSLTPKSGRAFPGQAGLVLATDQGVPLHPVFVFDRAVAGAGRLELVSRCDGLTLTHVFAAQATGVMTLQTRLASEVPVRVQWLAAPVLPAPQTCVEMIDVHGKWTREFHLNHTPWSAGIRMREARTGRSGHEHPPYLILPDAGCTNTQGTALALHYAWSGGHRMVAEELPDGRRLHYVEGAEQEESGRLPPRIRRRHREDQQEGDDLVPAHRAVVGDAEVAAGQFAGPDPDGKEKREKREQYERFITAADGPPHGKSHQGAGGPGRKARQAGAESQRDEMRRVAERKLRRGPRDVHGAKWSKPRSTVIGLPCASSTCKRGSPAWMLPTRVSASFSSEESACSSPRLACGAVNANS